MNKLLDLRIPSRNALALSNQLGRQHATCHLLAKIPIKSTSTDTKIPSQAAHRSCIQRCQSLLKPWNDPPYSSWIPKASTGCWGCTLLWVLKLGETHRKLIPFYQIGILSFPSIYSLRYVSKYPKRAGNSLLDPIGFLQFNMWRI